MSHASGVPDSFHGFAMSEPTFSVPAKKLAIWLFIIADAATFAGCLVAYGFLRNASPTWPRPFHAESVVNAAVMTFILVTSSLIMLLAVRAAKAGDRAGAFRWTLLTAAAGILFALLHIREWFGMFAKGINLFHNPWNVPQFGATFFAITGLHLLHVVGGVVALLIIAIRYRANRIHAEDIEIAGLYWHFVDLVWMFVVPFVYLLSVSQ